MNSSGRILNIKPREEVKGFLEYVNKIREREKAEPLTWNTAVKFLMARKFDKKRAIDLYINHEITRKKEELLHIDSNDELLLKEVATEKLTILPGRDKHGAAVALFTARLHQPRDSTHQIVLKGLLYQLDAALESKDTQRHGLVFIYDMTDSKYANFDYELCTKILSLLKGACPARLKKVLIVTAPLWFKAPFKILQLFVREKLRDRVYTISLQQLHLHIPNESLPQHLGGAIMNSHSAWMQICYKVSTKQSVDLDTYFFPCRNTRQGSVSQRSLSSEISDCMIISDIESEESKETISEKHSSEEKEKEEKMIIDQEKEVTVEKHDTCANGSIKRRHDSDVNNADDNKQQNSNCNDNINEDESDIPPKKRPSSTSTNIIEDTNHMNEVTGMTVEQLVKHLKKTRRKGLYTEYAHIKMEPPSGTFNISKAKYNLPKNRYSDVLCYDHSRVKLPAIVEGDPSSDYINANYVGGYKQDSAYISTQGPLPKTFGDFWRMIWHCHVMVIVMTTRVVERGRMKCGQYWPMEEESEEQIEEFIVINTGIEQHHDYTVTGLFLHNTKSGESRHLTHIQFTSWPDYGVPRTGTAFLDFLFRVRSCQADATKRLGSSWKGHALGPPIVVHCSAGIGRTGTFMTIDISLRQLDDTHKVDIKETVRRIRSQRAFAIQMPDQYVFCHLGIVEHALRQGDIKDLDLAGFDDSDSESDEI
ncbi:tyrosine-protein phosphatase non-receptor type 9-like isoform X1 [Mytilus trossulus]|uniref:tyrosine-protein phosphatase non-receptor type 9-like isoform X1 n=1 Tax=Mytilus trossulus TaxID=6551 RepID=UPI003004CF9D